MDTEPPEPRRCGILLVIQALAPVLVCPQDGNPVGVEVNQGKQIQVWPNSMKNGQEASGSQVWEPLCLSNHVGQLSPLVRCNEVCRFAATYRQKNAMPRLSGPGVL